MTRVVVPEANAHRSRRSSRGSTCASRASLGELHAVPEGRAAVARSPPTHRPTIATRRTRNPLDLAEVQRARATPRMRSRCRGRRSHHLSLRRAARRRQDDARPTLADDPAPALAAPRRSRSPRSTPPRVSRQRVVSAAPRPFRAPHHSASVGRARRRRQPAYSAGRDHAWRIAARSSSTSSPSSRPSCSTRCANRSKNASCASAGRREPSSSRPTSCWSPAANPVPVRSGRSPGAAAPTCNAPATSGGSRRPCSTASTSASRCSAPTPTPDPVRSSAAVRAQVIAAAVERQEHRLRDYAVAAQRPRRGRRARRCPPVRADVAAVLARAHAAAAGSAAAGAARIRRVARTVADLADRRRDHVGDVEHASDMRQDLQ